MSTDPTDPTLATNGVSPKALIPALTLVAVGLVIVVVGYLIKDDTLPTIGYAVIGSGAAAFPIAFRASPGDVVSVIEDDGPPLGIPSDHALTPTALEAMSATGKTPPKRRS